MEMKFNGPERQVDVCHVKKGREFISSREKVNVEAIRPGSQNRKVDLRTRNMECGFIYR